ncbi:MAG: HdeD family acid-resistance protein [Planctomycetes bacterium]|nr:HdeD family acid-resistance protein [Planctomycetota bacterium]
MDAESEKDRDRVERVETDALQAKWGWFLLLGVVLLTLGTVAIVLPLLATVTIEMLLGWVFLIGGVAQGVHAFHSRRWGGFLLRLLNGVLGVIVGVLLLANPLKGVLALTLLLAIFFVIEGVIKGIVALQMRSMSHWGWVLLSGVIDVILGGFIGFEWPASAAWVLGLFAGISLIVNGWSIVAFALMVRGGAQEEG